jgi:hypothetical protein
LSVSTRPDALKFGTVKGENDGKWKTATFLVNKPIRNGSLNNEESFFIELAGDQDITVKHVRVVRIN